MKLSILTPAIWDRDYKAKALWVKIRGQIEAAEADGEVEHLVYFDNKARSIGAKRQALIDTARGDYVAFVDDDDDISADYVECLLKGAGSNADVLTFKQDAHWGKQRSIVHFSGRHRDETFNPDGVTKRAPWHNCAWRREVVEGCLFGESNYGEDLVWCRQARKRVRNEMHIDRVLHIYRHDPETTAAPPPGAVTPPEK